MNYNMTGSKVRPLVLLLLAIFVASCAVPPQTAQTPATGAEPSVEQLLKSAATAQPIQSAQLRLQAAEILQKRGQYRAAADALAVVDSAILPPGLAFDIARIRAGAAIELRESNRALQFLDPAQFPELDGSQRAEFSRLRAEAYEQQDNPLAASIELINLSRDTGETQQLHDLIWSQLSQVDEERLLAASLNNYGYFVQGWIELALSLGRESDLSTQRDAITQWQQLWEAHPANRIPPAILAALLDADLLTPKRILLALPFSGKLAEPARIISEGVSASLYQRQSQNLPVPVLISVDTEQFTDARQLLSYATAEKADLIIGPLNGELIDQLSLLEPLPVPAIVFNQSSQPSQNIYQIDLSSDQEIAQVVKRASAEGHSRFALITPAALWGQKARKDFERAIAETNAEIAANLEYQTAEDLSAQIAQLLNTDLSQQRYTEIRQALGAKLEFDERPRRDIDAILMTASAQDARQIKPMLAFHFAGNYPVYASSHLYDGSPDPVRDIDLNGIHFLDIPWLLQPEHPVTLQLSSERTDTRSRLGRLYALGADAFTLHPFLRQLEGSDEIFFEGLTGKLTLQPDRRVHRELVWARFDQGVPVLLGPPEPQESETEIEQETLTAN